MLTSSTYITREQEIENTTIEIIAEMARWIHERPGWVVQKPLDPYARLEPIPLSPHLTRQSNSR